MNKYYLLRITLTKLSLGNCKLEYRELYKQLKEQAFTDWFYDRHNNEIMLPEGMYAALHYGQSLSIVHEKAEKAIDLALGEFYTSWDNKYTIIVNGPSEFCSTNLDPKEED